MKKLLLVSLLVLLTASIAKADLVMCAKDTRISAENSAITVKTYDGMPFALVTVYTFNTQGYPVCDAVVSLTTSRNQGGTGWSENVDYVFNSTKTTTHNGMAVQQAEFLVYTDEPAGTTFYAVVNGTKIQREVPVLIGMDMK